MNDIRMLNPFSSVACSGNQELLHMGVDAIPLKVIAQLTVIRIRNCLLGGVI